MKNRNTSPKWWFITLLLFLVVNNGQAQSDSLFNISSMRNLHVDSVLETGCLVTLNSNIIDKIYNNVPSSITLAIPLNTNRVVTIDLKLVPLWNGQLDVRTEEGVLQNVPISVCYRGKILGAARSMVAITFCENQIIGVVSDETGNYVIGRYTGANAVEGDYLIYNDKDLNSLLRQFSCGTVGNDTVNDQTMKRKKGKGGNSILTYTCPIVRVYVECEYEMYQYFSNSTARTAEYIIGIFNVVGAIYENEGIGIIINNLVIWTSTDPYVGVEGNGNLPYCLGEFVNYRDPYSGNVAYLFRKSSGVNGASGKADEIGDDLCDDDDAYAFQWTAGNNQLSAGLYSRDAWVCAHEIGHLLDSPHTQWCGWSGGALDNCATTEGGCSPGATPTSGGTIMSYCGNTSIGINFANGFGTQPSNRIRDWVDDYSYCMSGISSTACFQNSTLVDTYFLDYERETITAIESECNPSGTHGPVNIENTSGAIFWFAGQSISLKPGFHKKNLGGTFNARIIPWIDCETTSTNGWSNHAKSAFETFSSTEQEIAIIPNPATDEIQILGNIVADVELFSSIGLSVLRVEKGVHNVDVSQLSSGIYYARIPTATGEVVKSFMIIR